MRRDFWRQRVLQASDQGVEAPPGVRRLDGAPRPHGYARGAHTALLGIGQALANLASARGHDGAPAICFEGLGKSLEGVTVAVRHTGPRASSWRSSLGTVAGSAWPRFVQWRSATPGLANCSWHRRQWA